MNFMIVAMALMLCSTGVLAIASNSIGMECLKGDKSSTKYQYLMSGLIAAIVCVLMSFLGIAMGFKSM